jgi:hypothetical protein
MHLVCLSALITVIGLACANPQAKVPFTEILQAADSPFFKKSYWPSGFSFVDPSKLKEVEIDELVGYWRERVEAGKVAFQFYAVKTADRRSASSDLPFLNMGEDRIAEFAIADDQTLGITKLRPTDFELSDEDEHTVSECSSVPCSWELTKTWYVLQVHATTSKGKGRAIEPQPSSTRVGSKISKTTHTKHQVQSVRRILTVS